MTIKGQPDLGDPDSNLMCEGAFGRPTMQTLYGFPEPMLQVSARFSRAREKFPYFFHG